MSLNEKNCQGTFSTSWWVWEPTWLGRLQSLRWRREEKNSGSRSSSGLLSFPCRWASPWLRTAAELILNGADSGISYIFQLLGCNIVLSGFRKKSHVKNMLEKVGLIISHNMKSQSWHTISRFSGVGVKWWRRPGPGWPIWWLPTAWERSTSEYKTLIPNSSSFERAEQIIVLRYGD